MNIQKVNLNEKFSLFNDYWQPRISAEINGMYLKLVKLKGEFIWHKHVSEDELFMIMKGRLKIRLRDGELDLEEGEFIVIPKGIEHCPIAEEETHVLLLESKTTINTGDILNERTSQNDWI